jgi:GGDEF domain-containing protein
LTRAGTPLGVSVGVASVTDPDADVMDLLEIADRELYAVKPGGRRR